MDIRAYCRDSSSNTTTTKDMAQTIKEKHILDPLSLEYYGKTYTVLALV